MHQAGLFKNKKIDGKTIIDPYNDFSKTNQVSSGREYAPSLPKLYSFENIKLNNQNINNFYDRKDSLNGSFDYKGYDEKKDLMKPSRF